MSCLLATLPYYSCTVCTYLGLGGYLFCKGVPWLWEAALAQGGVECLRGGGTAVV